MPTRIGGSVDLFEYAEKIGKSEERLGKAQKMKQKGYAVNDIMEITGLSSEAAGKV